MLNDLAILFADAQKINKETSARFDEAWNAFDFGKLGAARTWDICRDLLTRFDWHVEQHLVGLHRVGLTRYPHDDAEFGWGRCLRHISDAFGQSGFKACFDRMRSGADGGAYAVLRELGQHITDAFVKNQIRCMISAYWDSLDVQQKLAAPLEYIRVYASALPRDLTDDGGWRIRADFPAFLEQHVTAMRRLERIGVPG